MTKKAVITSSGLQMIDLSESEEQAERDKIIEAEKNIPEKQKAEIRVEREPLFEEADIAIYKLEDSGGDTTAWRKYRQELRDMTDQADLSNPIFPKKPN
tara:strand:+ start:779 stop:1075 length:297 start_codon:yes stop_codon:yes gene_type:complete